MRRLNILFITNMCTHYVRPLFEIMAQRYDAGFYFTGGHEAYWHKPNELKSGAFKGTYLPGFFLGPLKMTPGLLGLPWKKCDAVIKTIDDRFALPLVFCAAKLFRKPFVLWTGLWAHPQTPVHRRTFALTKFIYRRADAIVTYGEHVRRYLMDIGIDGRKIFCAPHATDNAVYDRPVTDAQKAELKKQLGITADERTILYVGRLEDGKGLDHLIEAVASFKRLGVTLLLVGTGSKATGLRVLCTDGGVRAVFAGHVPNEQLYVYYALADIFVLPSVTTADFKEPWGIVINEAMNQGCAVVTTDAVGAAAGGLVEDGKNGFIVREKDSKALAGAFERLFNDERLRREMGTAGHAKIDGWTPQQAAEGFVQALEYVQSNH